MIDLKAGTHVFLGVKYNIWTSFVPGRVRRVNGDIDEIIGQAKWLAQQEKYLKYLKTNSLSKEEITDMEDTIKYTKKVIERHRESIYEEINLHED